MEAVAEAPSKVIITGEHFVVHGAWALAAALPRKVRVKVSQARKLAVRSDRYGAAAPDLAPVRRIVEGVRKEFSVGDSVEVTISSQVPEGAGLGSSASTMVAVASALSKFHSLGLKVDDIVRLSMLGEQDVHGRPSGIDPTICAYGGVILFKPGSRPRRVRLSRPMTVIVSYSGVKRATKGQIGRVSQVKERYPGLFSGLAGAVSELSLDASRRLAGGDLEGLGGLLALDHAALDSLGVSNETLDSIVDLMGSLGCYGAKLTGAGGGGSVLGVAPEAKEKSIVSGLSARGFETFAARIPVEGVKSWLER
ncbi:MAG: mevalonate kinase [Nitrososphaerota archaeon]|nr:mevalonate kinase [Nitrososphaerota archaeon]